MSWRLQGWNGHGVCDVAGLESPDLESSDLIGESNMHSTQQACCTQAGQADAPGGGADFQGMAAPDARTAQHEVLLDLRDIPADQRRATVFACFSRMQPGQRLVLTHHHHSTLLHYLLLAEAPRAFTWEYLQQGPALWRILISRCVPPDDVCVH